MQIRELRVVGIWHSKVEAWGRAAMVTSVEHVEKPATILIYNCARIKEAFQVGFGVMDWSGQRRMIDLIP